MIVIFVAGTVVAFVADHFIRPVLIGGAARLPFIWVLLGLLGGLETSGHYRPISRAGDHGSR